MLRVKCSHYLALRLAAGEGLGVVLAYLEAGVQVAVQPLHDQEHRDAGAAPVGVVDHRAVQVHQPLVFRQGPAGGSTLS